MLRPVPFSLLSLAPPLPVAATYSLGTGICVVTFDAALAPAVLDKDPWSVRRKTPKTRIVLAATAAGLTVTISTIQSLFSAPFEVVEYAGGDPLFTGITGTPVAPFGMPYVTIP